MLDRLRGIEYRLLYLLTLLTIAIIALIHARLVVFERHLTKFNHIVVQQAHKRVRHFNEVQTTMSKIGTHKRGPNLDKINEEISYLEGDDEHLVGIGEVGDRSTHLDHRRSWRSASSLTSSRSLQLDSSAGSARATMEASLGLVTEGATETEEGVAPP
jgi:hypothetical protein